MESKDTVRRSENNRVKTPTIFQMEGTECGAASLAMILAYYGRYIPLEELRADCGICRDGSSIKNVKKAALKHGLKARTYVYMPENLNEVKTPAILYWRFSHYVVFEGRKGRYYYINDPSKGRRKLTYDEIREDFSKVVVEFEKTEDFVPLKKEDHFLRRIKERISINWKKFVEIILLGLILVIPGALIPMLSQAFVDRVITEQDYSWAAAIVTAMFFALAFQAFYTGLKMKVLAELQAKVKLSASLDFLRHMFRLPVGFFEQRLPGALITRVDNNDRVSQFSTDKLISTGLDIFTALFFLVIMVLYSLHLTLIGVTGVAINLAFGRMYSDRLENMAVRAQTEEQKLQGNCFAAVGALETVMASGTEKIYLSQILGSYAESVNASQTVERSTEVLQSVPQAITKLFDAIILITGGYLVINGDITAGVLVAFMELIGSFTTPCNTLIGFFSELKSIKADVTCVNDVMNYEITSNDSESTDSSVMDRLSWDVEFRDVSFGYIPMGAPLIEHLSFKIEPGRTLALVGASGSGKSTVGKLANGLLTPWSGEVLYGGRPISEIPNNIFHYCVTSAAQQISMFSGTVRDNITLWNDAVADERIVSAAKDACIHDTIVKIPGDYYSDMKEGGTNFSGGERQRIEIARALVTNPSVVILDEATSALDPLVEKQIMDNIHRRGCACIIVAHRLSTIRDCDEILVLDHGTVVQRGTHEDMKDAPGPYAELIRME